MARFGDTPEYPVQPNHQVPAFVNMQPACGADIGMGSVFIL
jgi:hypothetical protein